MKPDPNHIPTHWETMFQALKEYQETCGHCNVPSNWPDNPKLGRWVFTQRQYRKKGWLNEECIRRLNEIGFQWQLIVRPGWNEMFSKLIEFKKSHGHCNVSRNCPDNRRLATWVFNQRRKRIENRLISKERIQRLNEIGFQWDGSPPSWEEMFSELTEFKKIHGHCKVLRGNHRENPKLSNWVSNQRRNFKRGKLSKSQIKRLNQLGFIWNVLDSAWEEKFSLLVRFKKTYGHCNVPQAQSENRELGVWASKQRHLRKENRLSKDRIRRLEDLGFQWKLSQGRQSSKTPFVKENRI